MCYDFSMSVYSGVESFDGQSCLSEAVGSDSLAVVIDERETRKVRGELRSGRRKC